MRPITWTAVVVCALALGGMALTLRALVGEPRPAAATSGPPTAGPSAAALTPASRPTGPRLAPRSPGGDDQPAQPSLPERELTAAEERDQKVAWLKSTGVDRQNLIAQATDISRSWNKLAERMHARAAFDGWECYRRGCYGTAIHDSEATIDELTTEISHSIEFRDWKGSKMRSGPVARADGKVEVTWVLFTPDDDGPGASSAPPG